MLVMGAPDACPICHHKVVPRLAKAVTDGLLNPDRLQVAYLCPNRECRRMFIAVFKTPEGHQQGTFFLEEILPTTPIVTEFSKEIRDLSPRFVAVHNDAEAAGAHRLKELEGMGLRKAIEFLVKDFAMRGQDEASVAVIQKMQLAQVIESYCDDAKLKAAAKRAIWLGNDESHYARRWSAKDVNDLRTLVRITVSWIEREVLTEQFTESMPDPA
ncbi:MAG TPA: hypothetical protein VJX91_00450 [Candidatus Eisenbacteria bacterium]|nr:hypothetical protein [Candidatus Eisenbacteria bacterium]